MSRDYGWSVRDHTKLSSYTSPSTKIEFLGSNFNVTIETNIVPVVSTVRLD